MIPFGFFCQFNFEHGIDSIVDVKSSLPGLISRPPAAWIS